MKLKKNKLKNNVFHKIRQFKFIYIRDGRNA